MPRKWLALFTVFSIIAALGWRFGSKTSPPSSLQKQEAHNSPPNSNHQSQIQIKIKNIRQSIRSSPPHENTENEKARNLYYQFRQIQMSQPEKALILLKESLDHDPFNVEALSAMTDELLRLEDFEQAREYGAKCLAVDEKNSVCHRTVISTYTRNGEFNEAYFYIVECLEADPSNATCLGAMIDHQINSGTPTEAKAYVERLTQIDANSIWSHLAQANYFDAIGELESAKFHYKAACKLGQAYACSRL